MCNLLWNYFWVYWIHIFVLRSQVHGDDAHQVDVLVTPNNTIMNWTLQVLIHDGHWKKVCPWHTLKTRTNFDHPISHFRTKLAGYLMAVQWVLCYCLTVMHAYRTECFKRIDKLLSLQCFLHVFESLTINKSMMLQLFLHFIELAQLFNFFFCLLGLGWRG